MEVLDLSNVLEIQKIREVLIHEPDLLAMFELLILVANKRLKVIVKMMFSTPRSAVVKIRDNLIHNYLFFCLLIRREDP